MAKKNKKITVARQKRPKKPKKSKKAKKVKKGKKGKGQYSSAFPTNRQIDSNQYWQLRAEIAGAESKVGVSMKDRKAEEDRKDDEVKKLRREVDDLNQYKRSELDATSSRLDESRQVESPTFPAGAKSTRRKRATKKAEDFEVSGIHSLAGSDEFSGGERQSQARRRPKSSWSESEESDARVGGKKSRRTPEETSSFTRADDEASVRERSLNESQGIAAKTYTADWEKGEVTQSASIIFPPSEQSSEGEHSASSGISAYVESPPPPTPRSPVAETPSDLPPRSHHRNTSHSPTGAGGKAAVTRTTGVSTDDVMSRTRQKAREKQSALKQLTQRTGSQVFVGETPQTAPIKKSSNPAYGLNVTEETARAVGDTTRGED